MAIRLPVVCEVEPERVRHPLGGRKGGRGDERRGRGEEEVNGGFGGEEAGEDGLYLEEKEARTGDKGEMGKSELSSLSSRLLLLLYLSPPTTPITWMCSLKRPELRALDAPVWR